MNEREARAEAERRWPSPNSGLYEGLIEGFVHGARWAVEQNPEPEWEYAHSANGYWNDNETEFTAEDYYDVNGEPEGALARRVKAGPWLPVEEKNP